jgi:nucleotide-binding universal stress UspA family protein
MSRPITVGLDGSAESLAAADWAARVARRRDLPLRLVHAWTPRSGAVPALDNPDEQRERSLRALSEAETELSARHPGLAVTAEQVPDGATTTLLAESAGAEMLVLGSRGYGALSGFLLGSVALQVIARAEQPVVMVRAGEEAREAERLGAEIVLGLSDLREPREALYSFAFTTAATRGAALRAVHAWSFPPEFGYDPVALRMADEGIEGRVRDELSKALRPWRAAYPRVRVIEHVELGATAEVLLDAAEPATLVVVGRRRHRPALGMRIGPVAHAALHHAGCPVAVVPHD